MLPLYCHNINPTPPMFTLNHPSIIYAMSKLHWTEVSDYTASLTDTWIIPSLPIPSLQCNTIHWCQLGYSGSIENQTTPPNHRNTYLQMKVYVGISYHVQWLISLDLKILKYHYKDFIIGWNIRHLWMCQGTHMPPSYPPWPQRIISIYS